MGMTFWGFLLFGLGSSDGWVLESGDAASIVEIGSSVDGAIQKARWWRPENGEGPGALLVCLHTWSGDFDQAMGAEFFAAAARRRWAFIHPDFRGPNRRPEAGASRLAVQDVLDAVDWAARNAEVDPRRVYLTGVSGGGHMALVMACAAPKRWAGVSAWVPVTDLESWHRECSERPTYRKYARDMEAICGGPPLAIAEEYRQRSPLFFLALAKGLAIDLNAGIRDGHEGSVPISHSLRAFNRLAEVNGVKRGVPDAAVRVLVGEARVPEDLGQELPGTEDAGRKHSILLRRHAGPVRLTLFDGGHEGDPAAAVEWLSRQTEGAGSSDPGEEDRER